MSLPTLNLGKGLEPALLSGHPWIYRNHLPKHQLRSGEWLRLEAAKAQAIGLYDGESAIAVRLFRKEKVPDYQWFDARVQEALELRESLFAERDTNAYRLIYGEGDYLPGITVDLYERYAVLQSYAQSIKTIVPDVIKAVRSKLKLRGIVTREGQDLTALWGKLPPPELTVSENGLKLIANLFAGQKSGLFLDHRDNRATVAPYCKDKTVLNLFSYTGAFSLYAAKAGAKKVTSIDVTPAAIEDARRNFALNGFAADSHAFITADCFKALEDYVKQRRQFDVVILDPPSLAKSKKSRFAALRAYQKLNALALKCVKSGGLIATASCTSQVSSADFKLMLAQAASSANLRLQIIHEAGQAADHPVPANFPEGRYLKFVLARVLPLS